MVSPKKWITLGKIVREWGIRGQVRFRSYNPESDLYPRLKKIYLRVSQDYEPFHLTEVKPHGRFWLFHLKGLENPEIAKRLRGREVAIPREQMPKLRKGELYISDIEEFEVIGNDGRLLGRIKGLIRVGDSDVMVIRHGGKEFMVPYRKDFVERLVLEEGRIFLKESAEELL